MAGHYWRRSSVGRTKKIKGDWEAAIKRRKEKGLVQDSKPRSRFKSGFAIY
ncbi:hypothetical protein HanIR_Chr02g0085901 [Helianthus annuus]|nr:hypothetical protein HanIR_Chr02g0085901 [Helianthus annuus]